ncbi:PEP-CTERM putative exosortase interaction domain-containing protein [Burkholderiales bacterium JOSHI_001]|nr:PEP-CTERM putative exosortase interaction domain-containing protein [Burkholderiales bacterium JOSHI_001]
MNKTFAPLACALALLAAVPAAKADVLSFDDLSGLQFFTADYRGFRFGSNNIDDTPWFHTDQANLPAGPKSGNTYLATDFRLFGGHAFEAAQAITSAQAFGFDGAWFSGQEAVRYQLFRNGKLVFTSANSAALGPVPQFVASGYTGLVDSVVVLGTQGFYGLDDFTFTPAVPEPQSAWMLAAGLLGLGAWARRRRA